jgi:hypothetical protein
MTKDGISLQFSILHLSFGRFGCKGNGFSLLRGPIPRALWCAKAAGSVVHGAKKQHLCSHKSYAKFF